MIPFLNTPMLGTGSVLNVDDVFGTFLHTTDGLPNDLIPTPFAPDFGWIKFRTIGDPHWIIDSARGNNKILSTNTTNGQSTTAAGTFELLPNGVNTSSGTFNTQVLWAAKFAPKFMTAVTYTGNGTAGRTVEHDLGVKPGMIVVKCLSSAFEWMAQHASRGAGKFLTLNGTTAETTEAAIWNNTEPTSLVFTVGSNSTVNANGNTYVAYLFAHDPSPSGIIQCGQYTGNGLDQGPLINLGWEAQFVITKAVSTTSSWAMHDNKRVSAGLPETLLANSSGAANQSTRLTFDPVGFRPRNNTGDVNSPSQTYVYLAVRKGSS